MQNWVCCYIATTDKDHDTARFVGSNGVGGKIITGSRMEYMANLQQAGRWTVPRTQRPICGQPRDPGSWLCKLLLPPTINGPVL